MPITETFTKNKDTLLQALFGGLCLAYFAVQPFNIYLADAFWLLLSIISLVFVVYKKNKKESLDTPKELKTLLWLCACFPLVSIISYAFTPLDDLTPDRLEPDTRWLLIIPIILAMRAVRIGPRWIITFLCAYAFSAFISASIETHWYSKLHIRADGHENAVPFGMFNATVAGMLLAVLFYPKLKSINIPYCPPWLLRLTITLAALAAIIATLLSSTRAGVLLIPVLVICLLFMFTHFKKASIITGVLIGLLALLVINTTETRTNKRLEVAYNDFIRYFSEDGNSRKKTSVGQRLEQWRESACIFSKHPVLGTGPRSYRNAHQVYRDCYGFQGTYYEQLGGSYQAHSVYFNTLSTTGLAGILLLLYFGFKNYNLGRHTLKTSEATIKLGGVLLLIVIASHGLNGISLDLWFRNHVMNKNLIIWALPLLLIFSRSYTEHLSTSKNTI